MCGMSRDTNAQANVDVIIDLYSDDLILSYRSLGLGVGVALSSNLHFTSLSFTKRAWKRCSIDSFNLGLGSLVTTVRRRLFYHEKQQVSARGLFLHTSWEVIALSSHELC
jgi:hypothetical protein